MVESSPILSVVVPAYRVEPFLPRCLGSILADPVPGLELVVVDDHSPDRVGALARGHAKRDPRVRVVRLPANAGLSGARNAGLARARGNHVWFVDGDDWLPAGSVRAVIKRLAETQPDVLILDHTKVFPDGSRVAVTPPGALGGTGPPGPLAHRPHLLGLPHSACTKVVRRAFLDEIELRFTPGWYEDCAFSHSLLLAAERIDVLDRVCYHYRQRADGAITSSASGRHFDVFDQYARVWARVEKATPAYDEFRPELFRLMIDHLLVIAGNDRRVPADQRAAFFHRIAGAYRRHLPADGYPVPGGLAGLKHTLVRRRAYPTWAALRFARRLAPTAPRPAR